MRTASLTTLAALFTAPAFADVPRVVVDIPPVHSLVAMVMDGVGEPSLLLEGSASPHGYSMRPSDARALQESDLLVWVGPALTPWLEEAQETVTGDGQNLALLGVPGSSTLPFRDAIVFASLNDDLDHGHDDHGHDDHGHDDHDHGHDHAGEADPHAWLHPENARVWIGEIAARLSALDPENADIYAENAEAAQAEVTRVEAEIAETLEGTTVSGFAVYHDAFQYFERAFGLQTLTSLSAGNGSQSSAARAAVLSEAIRAGEVACVFSEPQFADRAIRAVTDGSETSVAVLDPLGAGLEPGKALYPQLLGNIAASISACN